MAKTGNRKQEIIDCALRLMTEKGYTNTSMDDIVVASGLKKGSLYYFFPSKQDLAEEVLEHYWTKASAELGEIIRNLSPSPTERVFLLCSGELFGDSEEKFTGCFLGNMIAEMSLLDERIGGKACELLQRFEDYLVEELDEGVRLGELRPGVKTRLIARQLVAYFEGCLLLAKGCQCVGTVRELSGGVGAILGANLVSQSRRAEPAKKAARLERGKDDGRTEQYRS